MRRYQYNFLHVLIKELIFKKLKFLMWFQPYPFVIGEEPFQPFGYQSFGKIGIQIGMQVDGQPFGVVFLEKKFNKVDNLLFEEYAGFDFAGALAGGTLFGRVEDIGLLYALPCDLHQAELAEGKYGVAGLVGSHQFLHLVV